MIGDIGLAAAATHGIEVKREMNSHQVIFQPSGRRGEIPEGKTVLEAFRILGVGIEELTLSQDFQEEFMAAMFIPHMKDPFPHLPPRGGKD